MGGRAEAAGRLIFDLGPLGPLFVAELLLLGAVVGFLAGMLGIGGGMMMVPVITLLLLERGGREYSAGVHSSQARVIEVSRAAISEMLASFEVAREPFFANAPYRHYLEQKNTHYSAKLSEAEQVKLTCQSSLPPKKLTRAKQLHMNSILRDAENYAIRLENKERILEKRNLYLKDRKLITVDAPLFGRDDFPGYKQYMKRYQLYERRAKENSCTLPHL